jgi:hypothetical protein
MGFRSDGALEEHFALHSPVRVMTMIVLIGVTVLTLNTIYWVMIVRKIANKRFEWMMILLLMISLLQNVMLLIFLFCDTPPILDWLITTFGVYILMGCAILNCETLFFFSSLTEFWTLRKIRYFEVFWIVFHGFCYLEGYTQLVFLGRSIPDSIHRGIYLYGNGLTLFSIAISLTATVQASYITRLLVRHFGVGKEDSVQKRRSMTKRLICTIALGALLDLTGITFYAIGVGSTDFRPYFNLGVCCMNLHVNNLALVFYQLKFITIAKEEDVKKTIHWLIPHEKREMKSIATQRTMMQETRLVSAR